MISIMGKMYKTVIESHRLGTFRCILYVTFLRNSKKNLNYIRRIEIRRYKIDRTAGSFKRYRC